MARIIVVEQTPVEENVAAERRAICDTCEYKINDMCDLCGCLIESNVNSSCPAGYW